jgi:hypothetical protein
LVGRVEHVSVEVIWFAAVETLFVKGSQLF